MEADEEKANIKTLAASLPCLLEAFDPLYYNDNDEKNKETVNENANFDVGDSTCMENCQPCEEQGQNKPALYWCMTCPDLICEGCHVMHKTLRATRRHVILEIDDYRKIGLFLANFHTTCKSHPTEILNYFCFTHNTPCCCVCKDKNHQGVCDIQHEDDVFVREGQSTTLLKTLDKVSMLLTQVGETIAKNEEATTNLHLQRKHFEAEITKSRAEVNQFLDKLEMYVRKKFDAAFASKTKSLNDEKNTAEERQKYFKDKKETIDKVMSLNITKLQNFLVGKKIREELELNGQNTQQNQDDKSLNIIPIFMVDTDQKSIKFTDGFELSKRSGATTVDIHEENDSSTVEDDGIIEWQQVTTEVREQVDNHSSATSGNESETSEENSSKSSIKYFLISSFYVERRNKDIKLTSIKLLNLDNIVMSEISQNRVLFYKFNGFKNGEVRFEEEPGELAIIKDHNEVAVGVLKKLFFLNASEKSIRHKAVLRDYIKGVASANGFVFACLYHRGIVKVDLSGNIIRRIPFIKGKLYICVTIDEVLFSAKMGLSDELHSYNLCSNKKEVHSMDHFSDFVGLSCDNHCNVYLGEESNVEMFDNETQTFYTILSGDDGIDGIESVACCDEGTLVVVSASKGREIKLFQENL